MSTKTKNLGLVKPDPEDIVDIRELNNNADIIDSKMKDFQDKFGSIAVVETAAEMTDTDKVYVYVGNESGYKTDYWYYYKDGSWKEGRPFNSNGIKTDKNLEEDGVAADAAATGAAVNELKEDLNMLILEEYLAITNAETSEYDVSIDIEKKGNLCVELVNKSSDAGYIDMIFYKSGKNIGNINTQLLQGGESKIISNVDINKSVTSIKIENINRKEISVKVYSRYDDTIYNSERTNKEFNEMFHNDIKKDTWYGYLNKSGDCIKQNSTSENHGVTIENVIKNSIFRYSGYYNCFCVVCGYYSDGTAIPLLMGRSESYDNEFIYITDEKIVTVKAWSNTNVKELVFEYVNINSLSIDVKNINKKIATINDNYCVQKKYYLNTTNYDSESSVIDVEIPRGLDKTFVITNGSESDGYYDIICGKFSKRILVSAKSLGIIKMNGMYESTSVTFNNINHRNNSSLSIYADYDENILFDALERTKDKTTVVVDVNGGGDFIDLKDALEYLRNYIDVSTIPTTVFVKNGIYDYDPISDKAWVIYKGYNKINIVGESRDGVVLNLTCTGKAQNKLLDIGGECTIANLTINIFNDGTYTKDNDQGHNPYCIHVDCGDGEKTEKYYTTISNCKLYSECHSPVGGGLRDKQTMRFINCEFIQNNQHGTGNAGSLYVHASTESFATDMAVEIDGCTCINKSNTYALSLPNVSSEYNSLTYADIPVTVRRTIGVTNGTQVTNISKSSHNLQSDSALNNIESCNY